MVSAKRLKVSPKAALGFQSANKQRRQDMRIKQRVARDKLTREERFQRKREEEKNPALREERQRRNVPQTLELKRKWDAIDPDITDGFGVSIDVAEMQRRAQADEEAAQAPIDNLDDDSEAEADEVDSMIDSDSGDDADMASGDEALPKRSKKVPQRAASPTQSTTSTNLNLAPEALAARFPAIFSAEHRSPKILVTTSLNSTLHHEAKLLTSLFPNSVYIPRSRHAYGHKYSVKEICGFASNRNYTAAIFLMEDQKKPHGLDFVVLPDGPMFHFSISNWVEGKKLPGHGVPTDHDPELILNNFKTPLGLLTASMFHRIFSLPPQHEGRQVVTLHNQRDYIFVRRHRYVFREKRKTEKAVVGADGKEMKGAEGIKTGLQELGPRFTLKLRRIDKGIQRSSGQEWVWKGKMDKERTKFQL